METIKAMYPSLCSFIKKTKAKTIHKIEIVLNIVISKQVRIL